MREVQFRGKRTDNGQWVYGTYGNHTSLDAMILDRPYPTSGGDLSALGFWTVNPTTVGQYTGLTDKNGTKIFEGDILIFIEPCTKEFDANERFIVRWMEDRAGFSLEFLYKGETASFEEIDKANAADFEVIGNIYDNTWENCMGEKEILGQLRNAFQKDGYELERSVCESAADVIETLLAERDAAVEELRGLCWCCAHGKRWENAPLWSNATTCEHMKEQGVLAHSGGKCKCPHWQWRGPRWSGYDTGSNDL